MIITLVILLSSILLYLLLAPVSSTKQLHQHARVHDSAVAGQLEPAQAAPAQSAAADAYAFELQLRGEAHHHG
ncbi:hypothetical protein K0T92_06870 [Paenibacillus oenotherae]|uniref:Uncharacterized protein n=1 Tax=Paenibacillus oenotherae TaxID=1435645 RepID=A0ABS7D3Q6_9BACL|nr:hypothetical protein [Paenibacillus oenotherae]MBW7474463.1 hypothetical protein [Paenibacillus oenotherae]